MGRGRSSSGGSGRGMSRSSFNSSRGSSSSRHYGGNRTTVIIGGGHHGSYHHGEAGPGTYIFMAVIFILFGLMALGFGIGLFAEAGKWAETQGTCLGNEKTHGWYYTTYYYEVDGTPYVSRSNEGWEFPEDENEVVTIYYLKSDPNQITEERPGSIGGGVGLTIFAIVFVGAGVLLIKTAQKAKKKTVSSSSDETPLVKEETHIRCPYCGGRYDKKLSSCPKCGASRDY